MNEIIQELLPYIKGFAVLYLIGEVIAGIVVIYLFTTIIKKHKEFKARWK